MWPVMIATMLTKNAETSETIASTLVRGSGA